MAANISGLHQFANDVGPLPLKLLDDSYSTLSIALNTLANFSNFYVDQGTTNAYTIQTTQYQFASYTDGLQITVRIANTNTGASTLNVNGLGAMPILTSIGSELQPNALVAGSIVTFVYNAQRSAWQIASGGSGGGQITAPLHVTNPTGQSALTINVDGSGYLGDFNGNGLSWDAACHFNFDGGATLSGINAPFTVSGPNGEPLFTVATPVAGSGDCLITMGPGSAGAIQSGPVLCLNGMTNYPVLNVWAANATVPNVYVAEFAAGDSCTPGFSNGVWIAAGTNFNDAALVVENCAAANDPPNRQNFCIMRGDGSGALGPAPNQLVWDTVGHFTTTGTATLPMPPLIDLPGITITNPQNGEALVYDSANNQWVNGAPVNALATLNDVALTTPTTGQTLTYNAATQRWVNSTAPLALEQLTNTHISGPASGQVLTYSVSPSPGWVNATIPGYNFLTNLGVGANPQAGWVLTWDGSAWVGAAPGQVAQFPLSSLTDVGITTPLNRQVLTYDAPSGKWINAPAASPALATLPDVALTSQTQGQVLAWNATANRWENSSLPGGSVIALDTLMDTNISDPQNNQVLTWDYASARWVNRAPVTTLATLTDVALTTPAEGQVLTYDAPSQRWVNLAPRVPAIWELSGVNIAAPPPTNGQMLVFQGTFGSGGTWVASNTVTPNIAIQAASGISPTLSWQQSGYATWQLLEDGGTNNLRFWNSSSGTVLSMSNGGNVTVNAPTSGNALTVTGPTHLQAGAALGDLAFQITNAAGTTQFMRFNGDGSGSIGNTSTTGLSWTSGGRYGISSQTPVPALLLTVGTMANYSYVLQPATCAILAVPDQVGLDVQGQLSSITAPGAWVARFIANQSPGTAYGVLIRGGSGSTDIGLQVQDWTGAYNHFYVRGDGNIYFPQISNVGASTNGNVVRVVGTTGQLTWDPSARRYKSNIRSLARQKAKELVEKLRVVTYRSKCEIDDPNVTHYGLIAEEVAKVAPGLVTLDKDGEPSGVQLDHLAMLLLPLVQELLGMDEPEGEVYG